LCVLICDFKQINLKRFNETVKLSHKSQAVFHIKGRRKGRRRRNKKL